MHGSLSVLDGLLCSKEKIKILEERISKGTNERERIEQTFEREI